LLKGIDARGLTFYTNYGSTKADAIAANSQVSITFPWYSLHRQVNVIGTATKVSREESGAYFETRPHGSKLGAIVSAQSSVIDSREVLETRMKELEAQYPEGTNVPLPDAWGGYLITVSAIEFWQGRRSRLHDRLRFVKAGDSSDLSDASAWKVIRLSP
jgi:pyridoxamine 5'-phosphate oxidase